MSGPYPDNGRDAYADMSQHYSSARARALRDGIALLARLVEPCDDGTSDHAWSKCRRCLTLHEIQNHREPAMRLLRVVIEQRGTDEDRCNALHAALSNLLAVISADDLIDESVSYMREARAAMANAEGK